MNRVAPEVITVPVQVRWSDMDALRHVNNVAIVRLFEEARVRAFQSIGEGGLVAWVVARQEIEYQRPLFWSEAPATVAMWFSRIGGKSFTVAAQLYDPDEHLAAQSELTMVTVDATGAPMPLTEPVATWLRSHAGPAISLRR